MKTEKDDRRVKYTKMVLKESFIKLLSKKDISKITIKEICEDADINRATFYAHYNDQFDLRRKIENELLENIGFHLSGYIKNEVNINRLEMVEEILDYIKENAQLCQLLLSERGDFDFQKQVMMFVYDKNINDLMGGGAIAKEEAEFIYAFTITGCIGVIQKWLDSGTKKSAAFMAKVLIKLTTGVS